MIPHKVLLLAGMMMSFLFCSSAIRLPAQYGSNMVMQHNSTAFIRGWAMPGKPVKLQASWSKEKYTTRAAADGSWSLRVPTPAADGVAHILRISDGEELVLTNILLGEVWICSGQSNMEMPMKGFKNQPVEGSNLEILKSKNPAIRLFTVKRNSTLEAQSDVSGSWQEAGPETVREFSATAWYFGKLLHQTLNVPVGLVVSAWGGSSVEAWMSKELLTSFPEVKIPQKDQDILEKNRTPTTLYNAMIHPLIGFPVKGIVWYQGETNYDRAHSYAEMLATLVEGWRKSWSTRIMAGSGNREPADKTTPDLSGNSTPDLSAIDTLPFYFCQIAPYDYSLITAAGKPVINSAYLREAQLKASKMIPASGMAVLLDAGQQEGIHPPQKQVAGERLALLALAKTYGIKGIASESPEFKSVEISNDTLIVSFEKADMWLKGGESKLFTVAGADRVFYPAKAWIVRSKVYVHSGQVKQPVAVRYAFGNYVKGDLFGTEGLPVSSFRSDNWEEGEKLAPAPLPEDYIWTSPSRNSSESMPCGGGDIGLNVWVENGALYFYVARSGAWDENNTLLKLGRMKVELQPNPFPEAADAFSTTDNHGTASVGPPALGRSFEQRLQLSEGSVQIKAGDATLLIWVDVHKPAIHCSMQSKTPRRMLVSYESWRAADRELVKGESQQNSYKWAPPAGLMMRRDSMEVQGNRLYFYHQNPQETLVEVALKQQGIHEAPYNPLANLVSGGMLMSKELDYAGKSTLDRSSRLPRQRWNFSSRGAVGSASFALVLHNQQTTEIAEWKQALEQTAATIGNHDRHNTQAWWRNFWERSFIVATGEAATMARNYTLFRYMLACNAYGTAPTRFNGGLFTFDPEQVDTKQSFSPDYRKWGGGTFTAQNQRLVYWPMLKSGDAELMKPQFDFYLNILPMAELRTRTYWNHAGACFTEQLENFGLPNPSEYGWKRPADFDKGVEYNAWLEYQWETVLEFCQMILESRRYAGADIGKYLPLVESSVLFFTHHYAWRAQQRGIKMTDDNNQLIIYPGSACETYKMANNPATTIAGLRRVLLTLKDVKQAGNTYDRLPEQGASTTGHTLNGASTTGHTLSMTEIDSLLQLIPPLPVRELNGHTMLAPALSWERINNTEVPQLYPVFPWRFFNAANDSLMLARNTWHHDPDALRFRSTTGWKQDNIFAACLGLTAEAWELNRQKLANGPYRFPAFWGPGFDWSPDHNHGGSGMIGLQEMLLQETETGELQLLPAWPVEQDVHFRLHASGGRIVEVKVENKKVIKKISVQQ
jgi:hypothetical protein